MIGKKKDLTHMPRKRVRITQDMLKEAIERYVAYKFRDTDVIKVSFGKKHITATFHHCKHDYRVAATGSWDTYYECNYCGDGYSISNGY